MAAAPDITNTEHPQTRILSRGRVALLILLLILLTLCLLFAWTTRDAMAHLPFLRGQGNAGNQKTLVDQRPWQTAQALAPLAVTAEENEYAHECLRLADHEVEQAFDSALRLATAQAQNRVLTGEAFALSQQVVQLQQTVIQDKALVERLTSSANGTAKGAAQPPAGSDDVEVAKAQLDLDTDELTDAQRDLERASGDNRAEIKGELSAHQAALSKYNSQSNGDGQVALLSARQHGTLASRVQAWFSQRERAQLIQQAFQQAQDDARALTSERNDLEVKANASASTGPTAVPETTARLAAIKGKRDQRQLLGIYDDRIQTERQLAAVYGKWSAQVLLQHRIVLHLILQSSALIVSILICMVLCDALVRKLFAHPRLDWRRMQTLRTVLEVGVQLLGALLILLVVFGPPRQITTVLGLATAGLTIALQDFILAFLGWFVLMGKNGIRIGDWVEIDGVGGEVTEIGLFYTTLLETGTLADKGHPTGRRITFINSFAIKGQFFNFSTTGQWMWDEITVPVPASADTQPTVDRIHKAVLEETQENARVAEEEWKRGARGDGLSRFSAIPAVVLRPAGLEIEVQVRYVTRASERFELRNRLYQQVVNLLQQSATGTQPIRTRSDAIV